MSERTRNIAIVVSAIVLVGLIIWLDVSTGVWNEVVILSGLAAGLVTFILTVMVLDKIIARSTAKRWAPVTRLALSEFLHAIADEEHSEISRGKIVPRSLPQLSTDDMNHAGFVHEIREQVVSERVLLTNTLSRWAGFLASSGSTEQVLVHIADIAMQLDRVRDAALEVELDPGSANLEALNTSIHCYNEILLALEAELQARINEYNSSC